MLDKASEWKSIRNFSNALDKALSAGEVERAVRALSDGLLLAATS